MSSQTFEELKKERDTLYEQLMKVSVKLERAKDEISEMKKKYPRRIHTIRCDWEEVYVVKGIEENLWTPHLYFDWQWQNIIFYKTNNNRGEERGYFVHKEGGEVCRARRSLYQEWVVEKLDNTTLDYDKDKSRCRLVFTADLTDSYKHNKEHSIWGHAIEIVKGLRDGLADSRPSYKDLCLGIILWNFRIIDKYMDLLPQDTAPTYKEVLEDLYKKQQKEDEEGSEESSDESSEEE